MHLSRPSTDSSPQALHQLAVALWMSDADDDPQSHLYVSASESLTGAVSPRRRTLSKRAVNWIVTIVAFEWFTAVFGRTPRENSRIRAAVPKDERQLGEWARYQRRFEGVLTGFQRARLDVSPAFQWDILESEWMRRADTIEAHIVAHGQLPALTKEDKDEFALARWLGRQLRYNQTGTLAPSRASRLSQLLSLARGKQ